MKRMMTVLWMFFITLLTAQCQEGPSVSQMPGLISQKENSSAEIRCATSLKEMDGLYLRRRYAQKMDVLYVFLSNMTSTVVNQYQHRLSVKGQCCDFVFLISQLTVRDSDAYYCTWSKLDMEKAQMINYDSNGTMIIVKEKDPMEECHRRKNINQILFIISVSMAVLVITVFTCTFIWWCTGKRDTYKPARAHQRNQYIKYTKGTEYTNNFTDVPIKLPGYCDVI
ncbi:uncharacterized protein [Lepisosteus oculatus]|uniref:uncharacterized protein n=1 Tax=Lepisosteus oculatus TaxID=7918 RepID=UPI00073FCFEF|nr:PREDICTED: uncharacterized protein LOC107078478 [Lepisosteus oculatus]